MRKQNISYEFDQGGKDYELYYEYNLEQSGTITCNSYDECNATKA